MSNKKSNAHERLQSMQRAKEEARAAKAPETPDLVSQLTHEDAGEPDFTEIAKKLAERKAKEAKGENDGYVKMTIYIRDDIAASFNALITKRGQQKEFANQAFADFVSISRSVLILIISFFPILVLGAFLIKATVQSKSPSFSVL